MANPVTEETNGGEIDRSSSNLPMAWSILNSIHEQIRLADSKAGFIIALNAILFGFASRYFDKFGRAEPAGSQESIFLWINDAIFVFYLAAAAASVVFILIAVMSRIRKSSVQTKIFFGHIARHYGKDSEKYLRDVRGMNEENWLREVGSQIVEASHIALIKHKWVSRASISLLVAAVLLAITTIAVVFISKC